MTPRNGYTHDYSSLSYTCRMSTPVCEGVERGRGIVWVEPERHGWSRV